MEDLISRQAVIDTLDRMDKVLDEDRTVEMYRDLLKECYTVLPSVNPQKPKIGHWKSTIDGKPICSECDFISESLDGYFVSNYCPNCGARMEG